MELHEKSLRYNPDNWIRIWRLVTGVVSQVTSRDVSKADPLGFCSMVAHMKTAGQNFLKLQNMLEVYWNPPFQETPVFCTG